MNLKFFPASLLAMALAACSTGGGDKQRYADTSSGACQGCGILQHIETYQGQRHGTVAGAAAGAVTGGALGNESGRGDGKTAATVAGAVVGGIAGNEIAKSRSRYWYDLTILMNDGRTVVLTQNCLNGIREGGKVEIRNGTAHLN